MIVVDRHAALPCCRKNITHGPAHPVDGFGIDILVTFAATRFDNDFSDGQRSMALTDDRVGEPRAITKSDRAVVNVGDFRAKVIAGPIRMIELNPFLTKLDLQINLKNAGAHILKIGHDPFGHLDLLSEVPLLTDEHGKFALVSG